MDTKLGAKRNLIKNIFERYNELLTQRPKPGWQTVMILDDERDHYMLHTFGWNNNERVWNTPLYVRIQDGKIWVEEDWLEEGVTTEFIAAGIPNDEIVLAFHPPMMRPYTDFATE